VIPEAIATVVIAVTVFDSVAAAVIHVYVAMIDHMHTSTNTRSNKLFMTHGTAEIENTDNRCSIHYLWHQCLTAAAAAVVAAAAAAV
jgi:hypothetical protein